MYRSGPGIKVLVLIAALLCQGPVGCVRQSREISAAGPELFWPAPPETRRVVFLNAVSGPGDLDIRPGFLTKMFRYLGGITETAIVSPSGISRDAEGRIYVVDTSLGRVHVFDARGSRYSVFPSSDVPLISPVGIAVDRGSGLIFVSDSKSGVVKVFADAGKRYVTDLGIDVLERPTGVAVNRRASELLVVDTLQARVFRFDLPGMALKGSFGGSGTADGRFHYPTFVSVTSAGRIIVSDSLNFRVQVLSPEGRFLFKIGGAGNTPGTFSRPKGVAADSDGNIYVADALFDNVQMFDESGRLLMAFGGHGAGAGAFALPTGMYIDADDVIFVSDSGNHRIQMFQYLKEENGK